MDQHPDNDMLKRAARHASRRSFFVASALAEYQSVHQIEDDELAAFLCCSQTDLPKLALCRLPDAMAPTFRSEVERMASYSGVNHLHLAQLLREVASTTALQSTRQRHNATANEGALMAARDRTEAIQPGEKERAAAPQHHKVDPSEP